MKESFQQKKQKGLLSTLNWLQSFNLKRGTCIQKKFSLELVERSLFKADDEDTWKSSC